MFGDRSVFCPFSGDTDPHESSVRRSRSGCAVDTDVHGTRSDLVRGSTPGPEEDSMKVDLKQDLSSSYFPTLEPDLSRTADRARTSMPHFPAGDENDNGKSEFKTANGKKANVITARRRWERHQAEAFAVAVAATPAIETAVTVGPTELLAIGARAYHLLLAEDEKRRLDEAVAVLRATNAMVGAVYHGVFPVSRQRCQIDKTNIIEAQVDGVACAAVRLRKLRHVTNESYDTL